LRFEVFLPVGFALLWQPMAKASLCRAQRQLISLFEIQMNAKTYHPNHHITTPQKTSPFCLTKLPKNMYLCFVYKIVKKRFACFIKRIRNNEK
jgi:hypothetical protein